MKMELFKNLFDTWVTGTPDGRLFVPHPWETEGEGRGASRSFYLLHYKPPTIFVFLILAAIALLAFLFDAKLVMSICGGLLAIQYYALRESWVRSGALSVTCPQSTVKVSEKSTFELSFSIQNQSNSGVIDGHIFLKFDGTTAPGHYVKLPEIMEGSSHRLSIKFVADAGMGTFHIGEVFLITADRFGLFSRCVRHEVSVAVEVTPEFIPMPHLKLEVAGKTSHSGMIESKISGDSTSFLGLRGFRYGDSIRRIDWKRTAKYLDLVVRDFEKLNSTDATVFIDDRQVGLFKFRGINSFEQMKDSALTICRTLIEQGIRVQIFLPNGRHLPFGKGKMFLQDVIELIRDLKPEGGRTFHDFLLSNRERVPPDSLVVPVFSAVDIDMGHLHEVLTGWDAIRCQIIPVVMDAPRFEKRVVQEAESFTQRKMNVIFFRQLYMGAGGARNYENMARKIYEGAIVIAPDEMVGQVYSRMYPWQR